MPRDDGIRITERRYDARNARRDHRFRAGSRTPVVGTRLERYIERRPAREFPRHAQRMNLRMRLARHAVPTAPDDDAVPHDHRAHQRIWRRAPARELCKVQRLPHKMLVTRSLFVHRYPPK